MISPSQKMAELDPELANDYSPELIEAAKPFVGRWNGLVSTTNWEKGRIIHQWRQSLIEQEAPATEYSDEAWSRLVGGVTGQHVGRLRRVYDRFGDMCERYPTLYWSHFHAALDWEDAEEWLEQAVENNWSVSHLRRNRWETFGDDEPKPSDEDIVSGELDEDFEPALNQPPQGEPMVGSIEEVVAPSKGESNKNGADAQTDDDEEAENGQAAKSVNRIKDQTGDADDDSASPQVRPFEDLPELPEDLTEAFEAFKLAILRHKTQKWAEVSLSDVLASLDALKMLARAPSAD